MNTERHHSAGIVLFGPGTPRTVLLLRSAVTRRPVWEFPKGAVEAGETERQAAERELLEETGLGPGDYRLLQGFQEEERYLFTRGAGAQRRMIQKRVTYFLGEWQRGEVRLSRAASRYVWAPVSEAHRLLRFPEKRRVLSRADAFPMQAALPPPPVP